MTKLDLNQFFRIIDDLAYILIKTDTPYTPKNFPDDYPNKDVDIIVEADDIECIKGDVIAFCCQYSSVFGLKIVEEHRYRLYEGDTFHYQFDISTTFFDLPDWFIRESIDKRIETKGFFVCPVAYELAYRIVAYRNKHKPWHLEYIKKHKNSGDLKLLEKLSLKDLFYVYTK